MPPRSRRQLLRLLLAGAAGGASLAAAATASTWLSLPAHAAASTPDAWSSMLTWRTADGWYSVAIHASLLPDGRLLLIGLDWPTATPPDSNVKRRSAFGMLPAAPGTPLPTELVPTSLSEPLDATHWVSGNWQVDDTLFCGGHTLTADGRFFSAGGTRDFKSSTQEIITGLSYATVFDGRTWTRVPNGMQAKGSGGGTERWYPTVTRLSDGRLFVTSGLELVLPNAQINLSAEAYAPSTGTWSVLSPFGSVPFEIFSSDYTHTFVLPNMVGSQELLLFGEPGVPVLTSATANAIWNIGNPARPGSDAFQSARRAAGGAWNSADAPNNGAATALLPIRANDGDLGYANGSVVVVGGALQTAFERSIDVYDPRAGAWRASISTQAPRHYPAIVLLPDSRLLILSGASSDPGARHAEYVDPLSGFASSIGSASVGEVRGYHNVALLLPNGSVLVGGGRDVDRDTSLEKPTFRYYYPYYIFADRPRITSAPTSIVHNTHFTLQTTGRAPADMVLIGLGSMTHSFDMNQRLVQLPLLQVTQTATNQFQCSVAAPPNAHVAPAGYYMLFALDGRRIPSEAAIVQLTSPGGAAPTSVSAARATVTPAAITSAIRRATQPQGISGTYVCPLITPLKPE
jgi:hypothetical protein